jgi:ATP-dependent DNA helicase RecG
MIEELLLQDESKTLEFKENTKSLAGIVKSVIAFANTAGGVIVIGIEDKTKKVVGVPHALDELERLANIISDSTSPLLTPDFEIQTYRKKEIILIHVPHIVAPYYVKSAGPEKGVYVRFGPTNRIADSEMVQNLRLLNKKLSFDELPYAHVKAELIDWPKVKEIFKDKNRELTQEKAENLDLIVRDTQTFYASAGGIILFGLTRSKIFPDAIIKCARFMGTTKVKAFSHITLESYPIEALSQAILFIEQHTIIGTEIGRMYRTDITQYPMQAVREAVINAILHSDYTVIGASIMIAIFDDRLEITNPGGLVPGLTLARALAGSSRVRNRVIAKVFRELKLIEQWGSGLQRIIDTCENYGLKKPLFEDLDNEFKVTLYASKTSKKSTPEPQDTFMKHLKKKKSISTKQAAEFWDIAPRNARTRLKQLADKGLIKRVGTSAKDPYGVYILA